MEVLSMQEPFIIVTKQEYEIEDIFHIPYNLRAKISSNRYSISGYPSLYLSTSLELCKQELKKMRKLLFLNF